MPKRRYMAPKYITDRLAELALLQPGWHWGSEGRKIRRRSLRAAHERFREYDGPRVYLYPMIDGSIVAEFELDADGWAPDDEIF